MWQVPVGDEVEPWSLALAVNNLEAGTDYKHLPHVVNLLRREVGKKAEDLRAEAEVCARDSHALEERLRDALEVREANGMARPDAEYTPAQERALERLILETRDQGALEELCCRESARDAARAAGRSLAREVVMTAWTHADAVAHDEPDRVIAEDMGIISSDDPLRAKMAAYLECRREEKASAEEFLRVCREVAARQQARSVELTGEEAAVFTRDEYEFLARNLLKVREDREHDRLVREVNRARVEGEGGALEPAEPLPFRTFQVLDGDPRTRAGLLMGQYLCKQAEFLKLCLTKQPYSEAMLEADRAKLEMDKAAARHRKEYSTEPLTILSGEQADFIMSVTRSFTDFKVLKLKEAMQGALVVGRSRADQHVDVVSRTPHRDAGEPGHSRNTPNRPLTDPRENRGGDGGNRGRSSRW